MRSRRIAKEFRNTVGGKKKKDLIFKDNRHVNSQACGDRLEIIPFPGWKRR